jgi:outer membrane protein assembly factor BamA
MFKYLNCRTCRVYLVSFFLMCGIWPGALYAQYQLAIITEAEDSLLIDKLLSPERRFRDSLAVTTFLSEQLNTLHLNAYLEASVDSISYQDTIVGAHLHLGPLYKWLSLRTTNIPPYILDAIGYRARGYNNKPVNMVKLLELQEELLVYAENHGYPFARVGLDSIQLGYGQGTASLMLDKGPLILIRQIDIEGDAKISDNYIKLYLGIEEGAVYDNSKILRIRNRIRELPFLSLSKDPGITFIGDQANILLLLNKKKASRFDFVVGVLPQNANGRSLNNRNFLITGTFTGEFQNQFGLGERIFASFEQLRPETQELEVEFNYPYVLGLPLGGDFDFQLYKRDTSYLDLETDIGVRYIFDGGSYLKAFWNNRSSTLLNVDESALEQAGQLPENLDVRNATFGLEYVRQKLDYRFNPRRGWRLLLRGGAGIKRIARNNQIEELGYGELYDTVSLRSFQYQLRTGVEAYWPVFKNSTIKTSFTGGSIIAEQDIFFNEQFRIGGNRLLRGFDEESVFATHYAIATLEYRLLIGQNSYLYTFLDYARVDNKTTVVDTVDYPYGFGAGLTFETKVGLFGVSLAYGKQLDNPLDFSAPKVHFGYVSLFN